MEGKHQPRPRPADCLHVHVRIRAKKMYISDRNMISTIDSFSLTVKGWTKITNLRCSIYLSNVKQKPQLKYVRFAVLQLGISPLPRPSSARMVYLGINNDSNRSQEDMYLERGIQKQENSQWQKQSLKDPNPPFTTLFLAHTFLPLRLFTSQGCHAKSSAPTSVSSHWWGLLRAASRAPHCYRRAVRAGGEVGTRPATTGSVCEGLETSSSPTEPCCGFKSVRPVLAGSSFLMRRLERMAADGGL